MAWENPKLNWKAGDRPNENDFNRIEGNIQFIKDEQAGLEGSFVEYTNNKILEHELKKGGVHGIPEGDEIESVEGAQRKADKALEDAKNYVDEKLDELALVVRMAGDVALVIEVRESDPEFPKEGQIWLRRDLV